MTLTKISFCKAFRAIPRDFLVRLVLDIRHKFPLYDFLGRERLGGQ